MCGIVGAFSKRQLDPGKCGKALDLLFHRGPDDQTAKYYEQNRLFFGHTRLKVIDLSNDANQPFVSDCGNYEIIFNGEIFNFKELRKSIEGEFSFRTSGDTEVLLNLYRKHGPDCLKLLNGMFAFAIYDKRERRLFLARDRFGIKPLFYALNEGVFCFASEIKPLLCLTGKSEPDNRMIGTYLATSHCDFSDRTFFADVRQLGAGHCMAFDFEGEAPRISQWYQLGAAPLDGSISPAGIEELVEETISRSIKRHLVADVAVGLNVSGGVDSSTLIHFASQHLGECHTFTQDFKGYSERPWVEEVTRGLSLHTHFADLGPRKIQDQLQNTVLHQEQPFGGVAVIGYSYLYSLAKKLGITVLLDGNGIDEIFLGYKKYHLEHLTDQKAEDGFSNLLREYCAFWQEDEQMALRRVEALAKNSSMIDGTAHQGLAAVSGDLRKLEHYEIPQIDTFECGVKNSAARDLLRTKIPRGLRFNDRMSMMHSRELRVPFLDYELVELAYSLPTSELLNASGTKAVMRKVLSKSVDRSIAFALKRSIQTPQNDWLADDYRDLVLDVLESDSFRGRGWIDVDKAKDQYQAYLQGDQSTSFFIWQWINLEYWARTFFDDRKFMQ